MSAPQTMHANRSKEISLNHTLKQAILWHQQGDLEKAEHAYLKILRHQPIHADALNLLGLISYQQKKHDEAVSLISQAIDQNNRKSDYYNNLGTALKALGRMEEAREAYLRALDLNPGCVNTNYNMAGLYLVTGETDQAIQYYRRTIAIKPDYYQAYTNLSAVYNQRKEYQKALDCCQQGIQSGSMDSALYNNMGNALNGFGLNDHAVNMFEKAIQLDPSCTEAYSNLGNTLRELGKHQEAINCYQKALAANPLNAEAHNNLGTIFREMGLNKEATACYQAAMRAAPQDAAPYHNMGNMFLNQGKKKEALKCFVKALSIDPELVESHISQGITLQDMGKGADAELCFKKAIAIRPGCSKAYCHLIRNYQHGCNWKGRGHHDAVLDEFTQEALANGRRPEEMPFLNLTRCADPAKNYQVAKAWSDHLVKQINKDGQTLHAISPAGERSDGKITIGYLSNNFKNHPTAHLVGGMFRHHRREKFNIYCYSYGENDHSTYRKQIESDCDRFVDIAATNHIDAARQISRDQVDILVDLVGYMKSNRLEIPALRPAPIQVRWLGMAGTTGADFFDYIITDQIVTPQEQALHYSETFCYMPRTYQINNQHQEVAETNWKKKDVGLPENEFVYSSFCSTYKIDPIVFKAWMTILNQVPDSVLWLLAPSPGAQERLKVQAQNYGIEPNRLVFADKMDRSAHLSRLFLADLALDTMIVNGAATTSEALWCGLPVLTLQGTHFASRMASSILHAMEMPQMTTKTLKAYIHMAVRLARDHEFYRSIKNQMKQKKATSALFETAGFVNRLENLYSQMWKAYVSGENKRILRAKE